MNNIINYCVFDAKTGEIFGFYNHHEVVQSIISSNSELEHREIRQSMIDRLITVNGRVNLDNIKNKTAIEAMDDIDIVPEIQTDPKDEFETAKTSIMHGITEMGNVYIKRGIDFEICEKIQHFDYNDATIAKLKFLINNYSDGDILFYETHDYNEYEIEYGVIKNIYTQLLDNKIRIESYVGAFLKWIRENLTIDMYQNKEEIYAFGYINENIEMEVNRRYEMLKLCKQK
ncbi:hypothetical protein C809_03301 [Lachnospiraceae bacterium MD335]|nr:hypothetical protein C809_03301 [Lachnospiraceae bacterium MD335]